MRAGLVGAMMFGMGRTGRGHSPVHENETERQRPYSPGGFESDQHAGRLLQCRGLYGRLFLNLGHHVENQLLG